MYSVSMNQLSDKIVEDFPGVALEESLWDRVEKAYRMSVEVLYESDLAVAYMNSVKRSLFQSEWHIASYSIGDSKKPDVVELEEVVSVFEVNAISTEIVSRILAVPQFSAPFANEFFDATMVAVRVNQILATRNLDDYNKSIEVLKAGFFRNRGAYIVGRIECIDGSEIPLVIALLNSEDGIYVDAVITSIPDIHNLFSSTLANFHVSNDYYHEICKFLSRIMPQRPLGLIYSTIGFNHFGKVAVMEELINELSTNNSVFDSAIGFQGTVAIGFQSTDSSYSLKVIRDNPTENYKWGKFDGTKAVLLKYSKVHQINRTGSMLDNIIYYNVSFVRECFSESLLKELLKSSSNSVLLHGNSILFKHLIVQRRVTPLPVYLTIADQEDRKKVVVNLGHCIKNNAAANIFNKDLDARNYGVSQYQKVYLFDYDALELVTDVKIRTNRDRIDGEEEVPEWFFEDGAIFLPEEIESGLRIRDRSLRRIFREMHGDLMQTSYWEIIQSQLRQKKILPVRVYPEEHKLKRE